MQNSKFYMNIPFTFSRIKLHAPTKVILEFYRFITKSMHAWLKLLCYNTFSSLSFYNIVQLDASQIWLIIFVFNNIRFNHRHNNQCKCHKNQ